MPELRQNIITGDWVDIAPERAKRPQDYQIPPSRKTSDKSTCPFCLGTPANLQNKKIRKSETENIYVIENKFPAFVSSSAEASLRSFYPEKGFYRAKPAIGDHEVIIIKDHDLSLTTMPKYIMAEMLETIRARYLAMKEKRGVASIVAIYNHGADAGASLSHPHAQIFASGIVANTVGRELDGAERYFGINGTCVFCDIVNHETKERVRVVAENDNFLAATFFAARFPLETWIYPKKHESQFENTPKSHIEDLADVMVDLFESLENNIPNVPLNFCIHTLPTILSGSHSYHWHVEITPRLANYGGFELGSGIVIDIMSPEDAAEYLRKKRGDKKSN